MKGLIACEESQVVSNAFRALGHDFYSLDIQECSGGHPEYHIKEDFFHHISKYMYRYEFLGVHPVCRFVAKSGVRWLTSLTQRNGYVWSEKYGIYINTKRWSEMENGALFIKSSLSIVKSIGKGYVEQPELHKYAMEIIGEKATQIIQPWQFGHGETKKTYLWLYDLPILLSFQWEREREQRIWKIGPRKDRAKLRSKTYPGIAKAMAEQWGGKL